MVAYLWCTCVQGFGPLSWFWRYKEHPRPLSPALGLWKMLEVPDWGFPFWYWFWYGHWPLVHPYSKFWLSILILKVQGTSNVIESPKPGLKKKDVLCTFKIKIESQNFKYRCIKDQDEKPQSETSASSKAQNQDLKDMDFFCTLKIKIESQNLEYGCTKDQWLYPSQYQDAKLQSGISSILQSSKLGLKGHGCSFHLQNQDREPKFGICVYQRPVTISKSISGCQTPVRNLQRPPKPQIRT